MKNSVMLGRLSDCCVRAITGLPCDAVDSIRGCIRLHVNCQHWPMRPDFHTLQLMTVESPLVLAKIGNLAPGGVFIATVIEGPGELPGIKGFMRFAATGEEISAVVRSRRRNSLDLSPVEIRSSSPARCDPVCPVFGACGGCDLQHLDIAEQREAKRRMVEDFLLVHAEIRPENGVVIATPELPSYGYRRKTTLHADGSGRLGFYRHNSHDTVTVGHCPISTQRINAAIEAFSRLAPAPSGVEEVIIEEALGQCCVSVSLGKSERECPPSLKDLESQGFPVFVHSSERTLYASSSIPPLYRPGHFSQVNEFANRVLVDTVLSSLQSPAIVDLYSGAGNFALPAARGGRTVLAVELDKWLVGAGRKQAKTEGLDNIVTFVQGKCEDLSPDLPGSHDVILDPPRAGARDVVKFFRPERSPTVIYVSCFLPALARDLAMLVRSGYQTESVTLVDMFPQTGHVETVTVLKPR